MAEFISQVGPGQTFATLTTAAAFADGVAGDHIFECTGNVGDLDGIIGWQTGSSLTIRPARGQKFDGKTATSGAHIDFAVTMNMQNADDLPLTVEDMGYINNDAGTYISIFLLSVPKPVNYIFRRCLIDLDYTAQVTSSGNFFLLSLPGNSETVTFVRNRFRIIDVGNSTNESFITLTIAASSGSKTVNIMNNTFDADTDTSDVGGSAFIFNNNVSGVSTFNNVAMNQGVQLLSALFESGSPTTTSGNNFHGGSFAIPGFETGGITSSDFEDLANFDYTPTKSGLLFQAGDNDNAITPDLVGRHVPQTSISDVGALELKRDKGARSRGNSDGRVLTRPGWRRP